MADDIPPPPRIWWDGSDFIYLMPDSDDQPHLLMAEQLDDVQSARPAVELTVEPPATPKSELTVRDAERERWACWFDSCADLADDMTDGERSGMRHAAIHLRDELVIERVRKILLASRSLSTDTEEARTDG